MSAIDLMNGDADAQLQDRFTKDPDWFECWEIAHLELRGVLDSLSLTWKDNSEHFYFQKYASFFPDEEGYNYSVFRTLVHLPNGWRLSVVSGRTTYSVPAAPFEAMALTPDGGLTGVALDGEEYDDPWGYKTLAEVMAILKKVEAL